MDARRWIELSYGSVVVTDSYMENAYEKESKYLKSLDLDRLLKGFKEAAGIPSNVERYPGWEVTEIQGHTLGHYITAISQAYAYQGDESFLQRINYAIQELGACQQENGYLFAWGEEIFDRVESGKPAWVPWYTMHKIFEGLLSAYHLADSKSALEIAKKLGNWVVARSNKWDAKKIQSVLSVEYGGMNDCLYELYQYTKDERYRKTAHIFDEIPLFKEIAAGNDILNGLHANTTIPKILGAVHRFSITGESFYLRTGENFWNMVVRHHTYVTGGNSEWEHFGRADKLDAERTACNCETCNSYNMLKLSKRLFLITGNHKYMKFYEGTLQNSILASQNPETGMTTYFQPMATGYFKTYSDPYNKFWCCTGTGMENFTKLCEGIFFYKENEILVSRFVSSILDIKELGFKMIVSSKLPDVGEVKIEIIKNREQNRILLLRRPSWISGEMIIEHHGRKIVVSDTDEQVLLEKLEEGSIILITTPMKMIYEILEDSKDTIAFQYGPVVLCAKMGNNLMNTTTTGVDVTVPQKELFIKDFIMIDELPEKWLGKVEQNMEKRGQELEFYLNETDDEKKLCFVPYYKNYKERYGIYFRLYQKGSKALQKRKQNDNEKRLMEQEALDIIPIGNDQYELAHAIHGEKTDFCIHNGQRCRFMEYEGYVSYRLKVEDASSNLLCTTYYSEEEEKTPTVVIGGQEVKEKVQIHETEDGFYTVGYKIPVLAVNGDHTINVLFQNKTKGMTSRIYNYVYICGKK